jgi:hypothetical protein
MSDIINENNVVENKTESQLSFNDSINIINIKYINFLNILVEKFKYHDELIGPLEHDLKITNEKIPLNKYQVINIITENFLFCLEQISDHNADYFKYQVEKVPKKNGKVYKNKLPKIGNKTLLKRVLKDSDNKFHQIIFNNIIELFEPLIYKDENELMQLNKEYIDYVKSNFNEDKNFSKMIMVFDNIDNIMNISNNLEEVKEEDNDKQLIEISDDKNKSKNSKSKNNKLKNKKGGFDGLGGDFMKNLETTKIAQLAKNISEKINVNDFPELNDPSKLLSSLGNASNENGIQNLLKFVVGEVEEAFKGNNLNENDLVNEAQDIMGKFKNMSGFDPMSILQNSDGLDLNKFADIFSKMK